MTAGYSSLNLKKLDTDGFFVTESVCSNELLDNLNEMIEIRLADNQNIVLQKGSDVFGIRNFLNTFPDTRSLILKSPLGQIAKKILGDHARIVRSIYFDKTKNANWKVGIHQDTTIAVKQKHEIDGFFPWSVKEGVHHVQPPEYILKNMLTLRLHLDNADENNGALRVIAGSHQWEKMKQSDIVKASNHHPSILCNSPKGSIMAMRPLLLHESFSGTNPSRRRVLHFEFSADALPEPLEWYESVPIE